MTLKELLLKKGLEEDVNYTMSEDEETGEITITPVLSTRWKWVNQLDSAEQVIGKVLQAEEYMPEIAPVAELQKEIAIIMGLKTQELGAKIIAAVYAINESKQISPETFAALLADPNISRIERLLWSGSLKTAKMLIQALDNTYFSEEEKASILAMLADY